jgi:hypothetical protein
MLSKWQDTQETLMFVGSDHSCIKEYYSPPIIESNFNFFHFNSYYITVMSYSRETKHLGL